MLIERLELINVSNGTKPGFPGPGPLAPFEGHAAHPPVRHPDSPVENSRITRRKIAAIASKMQAAVATDCQSSDIRSTLFGPFPIRNPGKVADTFRGPLPFGQRDNRFCAHRQCVEL